MNIPGQLRIAIRGQTMAAVLLMAIIVSCTSKDRQVLALFDPVLPVMAPEAARAYSRHAGVTIPLAFTPAIPEAIYTTLTDRQPTVVILSPLLAPAIDGILDMSASIKVVLLGNQPLQPSDRLFQAHFSSRDAAELAGRLLSEQAAGLAGDEPLLCAALFMEGADEAIAAFRTAYSERNSDNEPIIERTGTAWSPSLAARLRIMDIRLVYIAIPGKQAYRWAREVFSESTVIFMESPLDGGIQLPAIDGWITWDVDGTLKRMLDLANVGQGAIENGTWVLRPRKEAKKILDLP
jgi:hypothetical protein